MRSFGRPILVAALAALVATAVYAQTSQSAELYKEARAREAALRREMDAAHGNSLPAPVLRRVRTLVGTYHDLSRLFPRSGYSDNALWQGAMLSADAFWRSGEAQDRTTAIRLLHALTDRFPNSSLLKQVPEQMERLQHAKPSAPAPSRVSTPVVPDAVPNASTPVAARRSKTSPVLAPASSVTPASGSTSLLKAIRREVLPDALRITLELEREEPFHQERIESPSRVFVDLQNTRAVDELKDARLTYRDDVVRQIRVGRQLNARTRVVLDLQNAGRYSVYELYDPYRIVIDFERANTSPSGPPPVGTPAPRTVLASRDSRPASVSSTVVAAPKRNAAPLPSSAPGASWAAAPSLAVRENASASLADEHAATVSEATATTGIDVAVNPPTPSAAPVAPSTNSSGGFSLSRQLGLGISRIVIDAGHGGHDPGAKMRGLTEADLVLDVAQRLQKLLTRVPGVEVVMTRHDDTFVPLEERTAIANRAGADLFLSIHANASEDPAARGIETYFLNFAPNPQAEAIAARENAGSSTTMGRLPDIVKAIALHNKIDESRDFATAVQASLYDRLRRLNKDTRSLGVKQAPFMVLIGATMPSILAEISFITNRDEGALLKTDKYRQQIAEALFAGIMRYQQSLKRVPALAAQ